MADVDAVTPDEQTFNQEFNSTPKCYFISMTLAITEHSLSINFSQFNLLLLGKNDSLKNGIQVLKDFSWEKLERS